MVHDYLEGNIVRDISNGQEMKITTVRKGLFNDEPSDYVVCEWEEDGVAQKREFHVDDIEFMSEGDAKPYDIDKQGDYNPISRKGLFTLILFLLIGINAVAHDFEIDGIYYTIISEIDKTIEVTHKGYSPDEYKYEYSGTITIPEWVEYNNIQYKIIAIGSHAFQECSVTSVMMPNSITSLKEFAFLNCHSLKSVTIPDGVKIVENGAFQGCSSLNFVSMPNSVIDMGLSVFYGCTNLSTITLSENLKNIPHSTFYGCTNLHSISIPSGITNIGDNAFSSCSNLQEIVIPAGITNIGSWAFSNCSSLTSITIPNSVKYVGCGAFRYNPKLMTIYSECIEPPLIIADAAGRTTIADYEKTTLFIPKGTAYSYFSSIAWKEFEGIREYTVTHLITYLIDDKIYCVDTLEVGKEINAKTPSQKEGYSFIGWENIPNIMPGKDLFFYGEYVINKYELIYKVNGNICKIDSIEYNALITPEPPILQEGYTFSGWNEIPQFMPAHNVIVTSTLTKNKHQLTYILDGSIFKSETIDYGTELYPLTIPLKEGYTFSGWSEIPETMPDNDIIVTGYFTINTYKLTYMVDGMVYMSSYVTYGDAIFPMAPPTKEGYIFSGWSGIPATMPASDVVVTGSFEVDGIENITNDMVVDVYNLQGIKVKEQVLFEDLESILPKGMYIVNGNKVVVE